MKCHASLIKTGENTAMPCILIEEVFDINPEYDSLLQTFYSLRCNNSKYRIDEEKVVLYNDIEEYFSVRVNSVFLNCLRSAEILLVDFHVWVIDQFSKNVENNFYMCCYFFPNRLPTEDEIIVSHVPFLNVSGTQYHRRKNDEFPIG